MKTRTLPTPSPSLAPNLAEEVMTAKQVAEFLQISLDQVYRLGLPRVRIGAKRYRYLRSAVLAWLTRRQIGRAA